MSTVTVAVPDPLDAAMAERIKTMGACSKEEYLIRLVQADCTASEFDAVLVQRVAGPFVPLSADWKEQVRATARGLA